MLYRELNVSPQLHQAVERMGFTEMTEIQEKVIPVMMAGRDVIAKAPTGTGKTCAFGIPVIESLNQELARPQTVVLAPTRELAQQIAGDLEDLAHFMPAVRIACVYGGANMQGQIDRLKKGCQIVVATPGRLMDHVRHRTIDLGAVTTVAFFGVYFKLQSFVFMPVFGMNNGMVPILGYNYGARKPKRMLATIKLATIYATCIMLAGVIIVQLFAAQLLGIFDASDALLAIGVPGLRIICLSFIFAGISVVGSSVFQALGHGFLSLWVSVIRQLVVLLPVAWAIAHFTGRLELVWLAFPIAELVAVTMSSLFLAKVHRQVIKPMLNNG